MSLDPRDLVGLAGTFLGDIDEQARAVLLRDAKLLEVRRGHAVFEGQDGVPRVAFVIEGTVRTYMLGRAGRELTIRFARSGSVVTTSAPGTSGFRIPIGLRAITDSTLVELDFDTITDLRTSNPQVNWVMVDEITRRLEDVYMALMSTVQGTIRERLAATLLDTAETDKGGSLRAHVSQRELANVLGTAREVVSRTLADLQRDGLVETGRRGVAIRDPSGLVGQAGPWWAPAQLVATHVSDVPPSSLDASPIPVLAVDTSGAIVYASPSAAATFGWEVRELVGRQLTDLLPSHVAQQFRAVAGEFGPSVAPGAIGLGRVFRGRRADGTRFPAEISIITRSAGGGAMFATVVDVSYRAALRRLLAERSSATTPTPPPAA
jgi:CRP/FNR family cyclic AMP-dependent transcriptional regulator